MPFRVSPRSIGLLAALACPVLCGCGEDDPIRVYTVAAVDEREAAPPPERPPAPNAPFLNRGGGGGMTGVTVPAEPTRLLGAIAEHGGRLWFFKLIGPTAEVAAAEPRFREWLRSIRFADGDPLWDTPPGWTYQPGGGMRFAALAIPRAGDENGEPLEATVIPLPARGTFAEDVTANLDRWRGQVGREPGTGAEAERLTTDAGVALTVLAVSSPEDVGGASVDSPAKPRAGGVPFEYVVPADWTVAPPTATARLTFAAPGGATATVSRFPAGSMTNGQIAAVWRGAAGTAAPSEQEETITVGGGAVRRIVLPPREPGGPTVLGAAPERGGALWLFKLAGPEEAVEAATPAFERFLAGVRFPEGDPPPDSDGPAASAADDIEDSTGSEP